MHEKHTTSLADTLLLCTVLLSLGVLVAIAIMAGGQ